MIRSLCAATALLPGGWARDVLLETDDLGILRRVEAGGSGAEEAERIAGVVLPGLPNLHSHAFQRGMAGLAERAGPREDTFWGWRARMYEFLGGLGPDEVEAIATRLYVEMLRAGYTSVGEFHYLHHPPGGGRYDEPAELTLRILRAARRTGIALTHLPALYRAGGFEGEPLSSEQRRFVCDPEEHRRIAERVAREIGGPEDRDAADDTGAPTRTPALLHLGLALHSLRAVPPAELPRLLEAWESDFPATPVHIHVAEQLREVEACREATGARPVEWLLDRASVDERWCLVHATHIDTDETRDLARSGAVAGLCPTTEANLGDGLFPLGDYLEAGGALGIGSDSHVSVDPVEELRWLEYGQRLALQRRTVAAESVARRRPGAAGNRGSPPREAVSTARVLFDAAVAGGARALGQPVGGLEVGNRLDALVLDPGHPVLAGREDDALLDAWIFSGNERPVRHVMVGGRWVVRDGRHALDEESAEGYRGVVEAIREA